ncbi:hypothetical protein CcaverHIS002_0110840 [Cutaneotrichosporon cavernicola]|nr:hypothetical protein CcaverHIS002_0110840 [Cutaneotrichosporon cavernicola]
MHPPRHLFALSRGPSYFAWHRPSHRCAHAAAFINEGTEAGPSRPRQRMDDYIFPTKGKRGGPPDPYEVLALKRGAEPREIKAQYYKLALVLHPDSSHPSASAEHFATLNRAYKLLSLQQSRTSYLQTGYGWTGPTDAEDPHASADAAMRSWARHARASGASSWEAGARARGFRTSANDVKAVMVDRHLNASKALAEARHEAALFGKERRDQIRRRVRENNVLSEIHKMERGEESTAAHSGVGHVLSKEVDVRPPLHQPSTTADLASTSAP